MPWRLDATQPGFAKDFSAFLASREAAGADVTGSVAEILAAVKSQGDAAVVEYTRKFDHEKATLEDLRVTKAELDEAEKTCPPDVRKALELAATRIRDYSERQMPRDEYYTDSTGATLGWRWSAMDAVGMYVPGGLASYPSSVLMNAVPARVAGVKRLVMVVPAPKGEVNPAVLCAAKIAGVDEIWRIGGAQAIAALAFGTNSIVPVDKIIGPGNAYVAEAKRQVFGIVGIDMIAGPSEIVVLADKSAEPTWVAADLLSQAEHDVDAQSVLITDSAELAEAVEAQIEEYLKVLSKGNIASAAWGKHGALIVVSSLEQGIGLVNQLAPEHVEVFTESAEALAGKIHHAGAVFIGRYTPEAIGDYVAGPSHVLPTFRTARFSSGLSVLDFMKRSSIIGMTKESLQAIGHEAHDLAQAEGLTAHALSVAVRLKQ